jgi:hypothetical protein
VCNPPRRFATDQQQGGCQLNDRCSVMEQQSEE